MTINKFQGKTKEEAIEKAKKEFGPNAVIMNVKEIKPKGLKRAFGTSTFEVTAAMEEKENYVSPLAALMKNERHENINLAADEPITIPRRPRPAEEMFERKKTGKSEKLEKPEQTESSNRTDKPKMTTNERKIEERLDTLSNMLEERLMANQKNEPEKSKSSSSEELNFIRILYNKLINNEVHERYVNQIVDEIQKSIRPENSVETMLSTVYQKLILRFGHPSTIEMTGSLPKVVFFIGPTGVGKTTTIAKIASKYKVEKKKKVAFITADTYRIAATEQLKVYANILDSPMSIVYESQELNETVDKMADYDLIFVDTAGFSHKNIEQRKDVKNLIDGLSPEYQKEVYLVLSATTKYEDLLDIIDIYNEISEYKLIFTKLDETSKYGNILNVRLYSGASLSYVTDGQNVPDDIEEFETQKMVKQLLGGK